MVPSPLCFLVKPTLRRAPLDEQTMPGETVVSVTVAVVSVTVAVDVIGVTLVSTMVADVLVIDAVEIFSKGQEPIEPFLSRFKNRPLLRPEPKEKVYPAATYSPSRVC